jgi:glyoxylase-like metal-dependent hydrolase (beta-lactamase superfamily II)
MSAQVPVSSSSLAERINDASVQEVLPDLAYKRLAIVNVVFVDAEEGWLLIDAGLTGTAGFIHSAAETRYGRHTRPRAIVLTHGHFDHVGALVELAGLWDVPVYAHKLEHPFLDGSACYAPPDPTVGGGLMALVAPLYPRGPIDVAAHLKQLPDDGTIPGLQHWKWLHTPGHSPGHISLWRESDRTLVAGDAVITTRQESAYAVLTQEPELHGPPMYYTPDWEKARSSARRIADLAPNLLLSGHGQPLEGNEMREGLRRLALNFDHIAVPAQGRYVHDPST